MTTSISGGASCEACAACRALRAVEHSRTSALNGNRFATECYGGPRPRRPFWLSGRTVDGKTYSVDMSTSGPEMEATRRNHAAPVIVISMALWFFAVPVLAALAFFTGFRLPEAGPLSHKQAAKSGTLILALVVVLVVPPAAAAVAGFRNHRPIVASVCALITAAGLAAGFLLVPWGLNDLGWVPAPAATHETTPSHCVERSGGDTRCPGG